MIRLEGMNDTKKNIEFSAREQSILHILLENASLSSSEVHELLLQSGEKASLVTIKRDMTSLVELGALRSIGAGRAVTYELTTQGRMFVSVDADSYCSVEPDQRKGMKTYNHELFSNIPPKLFAEEDIAVLENATAVYREKSSDVSEVIRKKELERLIIELAWKSSKIEGNTYTLLETEKLILEDVQAEGHEKSEAQMILNHKTAFSYIYENSTKFQELDRKKIEEVHELLVQDLEIGKGARAKGVGVLGSVYRPLDNVYQIHEAVDALTHAVNTLKTPYAKTLLVLLGISYIQPFEDGNKRTSRLVANAVLMAHKCAPLSYRSVSEEEYRKAMLVFYELNSLVPFRKIFIEQYVFAANNYSLGLG